MKYKQRIILELERYPENCKECPEFCQHPYICHDELEWNIFGNETGLEANCRLGYMRDDNMRDFCGDKLYKNCGIRYNPDVSIMKGE